MAPGGMDNRRQHAWWWPEQKRCDECVWDMWCLVYLSGVDDKKEFDSFRQYPSSSGKGILINDDEEHFGLMDTDSSPIQVERFVLGVKPPGWPI